MVKVSELDADLTASLASGRDRDARADRLAHPMFQSGDIQLFRRRLTWRAPSGDGFVNQYLGLAHRHSTLQNLISQGFRIR
ncbi:MAG: hypothetical protein M3Y22_13795, partial [Pseudomonadota bacterium]|nr:hypothetical protein [Pseudomonadota bacterium]